ncbi:30S ribosomal protein S17 [Candidatus Gottesmanbacteria bacterium]|nr:30S ribosomal protein S17 [Candidatus Gottesmanbacteria bacterium]
MKIISGKIVSAKMNKTVVVEVLKQRLHPLYKKVMRSEKRYKAHFEGMELKEGMMVKIVQVRPISRDKHYKVVEILK